MNKYLFSTLFAVAIAGNTHAKEINSLEFVADNYRTSFLDLPLQNQAGAIVGGLFGGGCTLLVTRAITNIFQAKKREWDSFDPSTYTWVEFGTGPIGALWVTKMIGDNFKPEAVAKEANENGLLNLILESTTVQEIQTALDEKFITHRFPRSQAFTQLAYLRIRITHLKDLITKYNAKRSNRNFNKIQAALNANLKKIDSALLILKKDSRWFEECNAHTLNRAQGIQETQQKAEFAGAAINLAHAYAKSR